MKEEDEAEDVEVEIDEQEEDEIDAQQEDADRETKEKTNSLPAWAMNLEVGSKKMPIKGLVNIDVSEAAAQLFDNAVISKILQMYEYYYDQRVMMKPDEYYDKMISNKIGRIDIDGICPYTGEDDKGSLKPPSHQQLMDRFEQKATTTPWSQKERILDGRPKDMMEHVVKTLETYEKMMEFLVQAGYIPERMKFLVPMNKMKGSNEEKGEMRKMISDFVSRLMKGAFPSSENYTYFRSGNHGFPKCQELPAFTVYFAFRENQRSEELLIAAQQCGVVLPEIFVAKIAYSLAYAEQEAQRGRLRWKQSIAPNLDPEVTKAVFKSIGDNEGAQHAADASRSAAAGHGHEPKSMGPKPPPPKDAPAETASSSSYATASSAPSQQAKLPQKAKKCKLQNTGRFSKRVQQNATDAFHQMLFKSVGGPLESVFQSNYLGGFLENSDIPPGRTAWPHAFVNGGAGSRCSKRSPTVLLPHALVNENAQL